MQKKQPNGKIGFFKNYINHLVYVSVETLAKHDLTNNPPVIKDIYPLMKEKIAYSNMLTAFYDRYDITDECLGAVAGSTVINLFSFGCVFKAAYEAGFMIAIQAGMVRNDEENHQKKVVEYFIAAIVLQLYSYLYAIKSGINLVTRTLATLIDGYKEPDQDRFKETCTEKESFFTTVIKEGKPLLQSFRSEEKINPVLNR